MRRRRSDPPLYVNPAGPAGTEETGDVVIPGDLLAETLRHVGDRVDRTERKVDDLAASLRRVVRQIERRIGSLGETL